MHFKTKYKSHASGPAIGQPHIVCTCFWLEKARYIWFCLLCLAFNCFWWIGIDNGRSISNCSRFQSCSYANDVATTHVVYNRIVSECDHENNQSTHICIYEPYKNSKLLPIKILEAILLILLLIRRKKKKCFEVSYGPKTPLVACVFYFVLICTCFWLNVNRCTCFWQLPYH